MPQEGPCYQPHSTLGVGPLLHLQNSALRRKANWDGHMSLSARVLEELDWWHDEMASWSGLSMIPIRHSHVLTTDASSHGWGGWWRRVGFKPSLIGKFNAARGAVLSAPLHVGRWAATASPELCPSPQGQLGRPHVAECPSPRGARLVARRDGQLERPLDDSHQTLSCANDRCKLARLGRVVETSGLQAQPDRQVQCRKRGRAISPTPRWALGRYCISRTLPFAARPIGTATCR